MHVGAHTECGAANERNREREGAHECEFGLNVLPSLLYLISLMNPKSSTNWLLIVIESCNANRKPNDVIFPVVCCFVMYVIIVTFFCVVHQLSECVGLAAGWVLLRSEWYATQTQPTTFQCGGETVEFNNRLKQVDNVQHRNAKYTNFQLKAVQPQVVLHNRLLVGTTYAWN